MIQGGDFTAGNGASCRFPWLRSYPTALLVIGTGGESIYGEKFEVKAQVQSIRSMSAHGDYDDLLHFISSQDTKKVKKIFLVHGEYDVQQHFRQKIIEKSFANVEIPYQHQKIEL